MAANKHVPVIDSKQNYFNLLANVCMCIVLSDAFVMCEDPTSVFSAPCLTGSGR